VLGFGFRPSRGGLWGRVVFEGQRTQDPLEDVGYMRMPAPSTSPLPENLSFLQDMAELPENLGLRQIDLVTPWANCTDQGAEEIPQPPGVNYELYALPDALRSRVRQELFHNTLPFVAIVSPKRPSLVEMENAVEETAYELHSLQAVYSQHDAALQPLPRWVTWLKVRDLGDASTGSLDAVAKKFGGLVTAAFSVPYQRHREPPDAGLIETMKQRMRQAMPNIRGTYAPTRQVPISGLERGVYAPTRQVPVGSAEPDTYSKGRLALAFVGTAAVTLAIASYVWPEK